MSSLWTPGGEVPVDRNRPTAPADEASTAPGPAPDPGSGTPDEAQLRAQMERMQQMLLEQPAADVIAQHAMGLSELAALHLSQPTPSLPDARLAIDAFAALVEGLAGRLGEAEPSLRQVLPQLQMFYVQIADRSSDGSDTDA